MIRKIIPETSFSREIEFRIDTFGIYLLAYEYGWHEDYDGRFYPVLDRGLIAGISYQYPLWLTNWLNKRDVRADDFPPSTNHFSFYVWESRLC